MHQSSIYPSIHHPPLFTTKIYSIHPSTIILTCFVSYLCHGGLLVSISRSHTAGWRKRLHPGQVPVHHRGDRPSTLTPTVWTILSSLQPPVNFNIHVFGLWQDNTRICAYTFKMMTYILIIYTELYFYELSL